jgi:hypothetical protein
MTETELERLERDVEQARKRLTGDLALLRRPTVLSGFQQDAKDELIHRATGAASSQAKRFLTDIKNRAAANPVAVLAITTGLAWRLVRYPPISSILIGLGIAGLFRTDPASRPSPVVVRASELASSAPDLANNLAEEAHQQSVQARRSANDMFEQVTDSVGASRAREAGRAVLSRTASVANDMSSTLAGVARDADTRDNYLLGAAALAIGAAAVIGYRRREE